MRQMPVLKRFMTTALLTLSCGFMPMALAEPAFDSVVNTGILETTESQTFEAETAPEPQAVETEAPQAPPASDNYAPAQMGVWENPDAPIEPEDQSNVTLKAGVQVFGKSVSGIVVDSDTQQPLEDAKVSIPAFGLTTVTDAAGLFLIPVEITKPAILQVSKGGYPPAALTLPEQANEQQFRIGLHKLGHVLIVDAERHHLGDNSYSPESTGAGHFQALGDGAISRLAVDIPADFAPGPTTALLIGSILGLDTDRMHELTGNPIRVHTSPLAVRVNGRVVSTIYTDGDNIRIPLPPSVFVPGQSNRIEIETGHHFPQPGRLDYDDMEWTNLLLYP